MAHRHPARRGLDFVRHRVLRHDCQTHAEPYLCGQLVLRGADHRRGGAAHIQQPGDPGLAHQILFHLSRCDGCHDAVVVRAQRGRVLSDGGISRHHVLLRAEAGRAAGLFVPALNRSFLVSDRNLRVGGAASPALHLPAGLDPEPGHGDVVSAAGTVLGWHDQRHHDPVRRLGETAHGSDPEVPDRVAVVLRHVDLRRADDVHQDGQRLVPQHGLDHRARTCGCARLGGNDQYGRFVPSDTPALRTRPG